MGYQLKHNTNQYWQYYERELANVFEWKQLTCLKALLTSLDNSISLNMPSSLEVNPPPHSCFSLDSMLFSASTLADFPTSKRLAKSYSMNRMKSMKWLRIQEVKKNKKSRTFL